MCRHRGRSSQPATNFGSLSGDGRYVLFGSDSPNVVPGDTNARSDIFRLDRHTGEMRRVSVGSGNVQGTGDSQEPSASRDGRYIAFASTSPNLVADDRNARSDIFVHDAETGATTRATTCSSTIA